MFKKFFNKNDIKLNKINYGSHGNHWDAFFGFEKLKKDQSTLFDLAETVLKNKKIKKINQKYSTTHLKTGALGTKMIIDSKKMTSFFPTLESEKAVPFETKSINEWSHVNGIEAQVLGAGRETFGLNFFATDYLENKNVYQKNKHLKIHLSAIAYVVQEVEKLPDNFSEKFVSYMPNQKTGDHSDYDFIGEIIDFKECVYGDVSGFILTTKLIHNEEVEDFFSLDIFVNRQELKVKKLEKGMKISGCFWLQGRVSEQ